jgi:hypothetical protein
MLRGQAEYLRVPYADVGPQKIPEEIPFIEVTSGRDPDRVSQTKIAGQVARRWWIATKHVQLLGRLSASVLVTDI